MISLNDVLHGYFWFALGVPTLFLVLAMLLRERVQLMRAGLALVALILMVPLVTIFLDGILNGGSAEKAVTWLRSDGGGKTVDLIWEVSGRSVFAALFATLLPTLAVAQFSHLKAEIRGDRYLLATFPGVAAVLFLFLSDGFWGAFAALGFIFIAAWLSLSAQWEWVGESVAAERMLRSWLFAAILLPLIRLVLVGVSGQEGWGAYFAVGLAGGATVIASAAFCNLGPFFHAPTQELQARAHAWRRLFSEWFPQVAGATLVALFFRSLGYGAETAGVVGAAIAVWSLLAVFRGVAQSAAETTGSSLLSILALMIVRAGMVADFSGFKPFLIWVFLMGWAILGLQGLLRPTERDAELRLGAHLFLQRVLIVGLVAALLGAPGFIGGIFFWGFAQATSEDPLQMAALVLVGFGYATLVLLWGVRTYRQAQKTFRLGPLVGIPVLALIGSSALLWDGSLTGGWLRVEGSSLDQVLSGGLGQFFQWSVAPSAELRGVFGAVLFVVIVSVFFSVRKNSDVFLRLEKAMPGFYRALDRGLGVDEWLAKPWRKAVGFLSRSQRAWEQSFLEKRVYRGMARIAEYMGHKATLISKQMDKSGARVVEETLNAASLVPRIFQVGDLRWYFFWALLFGGLIFLKQGWFLQ